MAPRSPGKGSRRLVGLVLVLALAVVAACTSDSDDDDDGGASAEEEEALSTGGDGTDSTVGITEDTINVSMIYGDTTQLQQAGVLQQLGEQAEQFQVFVDRANEAGGAAGRQIAFNAHTYPVPSLATDQRPACVSATEEDEAFVVVFGGGQAEETLLCVADEHETLSLAVAANARNSTFAATDGRLFTNDPSTTRLMRSWVTAVDEQGLLEDATIGIVRPDLSQHEEVAASLTTLIEDAGFEVAEEVALPCEGQTCEQPDVGAERLQTAGVDTVFSLLPAIPYPSFVGAASAIGFEPQWLSSDFEYQVYDVTAQLFGDVAEAYDGAVGLGTTLAIDEPDAPRTECNEQFTEATGETFEPLSDGWQNVGTMCFMVDRIVQAADAAEEAGGLNQATFIDELEQLEVVEGERQGAFGPDKHDAYDTYQLYEFGADCLCWNSIEGSVGTDEG